MEESKPKKLDSERVRKLVKIAHSTGRPHRYNRNYLNKMRLQKYNNARQDFQKSMKKAKIDFLRRSRSEAFYLHKKRRLERLTLQEDSGQAMFDLKKEEEKKIENMSLMKKKEIVLSKMNLSKSMSSIGVNFWNNPYGKSRKSVKMMVSHIS